MVYAMREAFRRYGTQLILKTGEAETVFRGFLQHSGSKSWQNMENAYGPLGQIPRGQYVLLAPVEPEMAVGDTLAMGALQVVIRRLEDVMVGDRCLYRWGWCVEKGSEDHWGSQL